MEVRVEIVGEWRHVAEGVGWGTKGRGNVNVEDVV